MVTSSLHDSLGRRSRFTRIPGRKRLVLGPRDTVILRWLYRYRFLRQNHLLSLIQPRSEKRFIERLGDLFHETGYLSRPFALPQRFDARTTPMLYEISPAGTAYLEALDAVPPRAVTFSRRSRGSYSPQHLHTMMIIDELLGVELTARKTAGQRFVPVDEILTRAPEKTRKLPNPLSIPVTIVPSPKHPIVRTRIDTHVIPDALYGIETETEHGKQYEFWALECERTSPASRSAANASSTALKAAAYDALIGSEVFRTHWGLPSLKVRFVAMGYESRCRHGGSISPTE